MVKEIFACNLRNYSIASRREFFEKSEAVIYMKDPAVKHNKTYPLSIVYNDYLD